MRRAGAWLGSAGAFQSPRSRSSRTITPIEERPALRAALDALRAHGAGVLVVARRDRVACDVVLAGEIERAVARTSARLVSATGEGNGDSPADALLRTVIDGAAQYERGMIKARTRAALAAKRARRERVGAIPYGFVLERDGVHLVAAKQEQGTITRARDLRARVCRCGRSPPGWPPRDASAVEGAGFCQRKSRACWPLGTGIRSRPPIPRIPDHPPRDPANPGRPRSRAAFPERHQRVTHHMAPAPLSLAPQIMIPIHHL